MRKTAAWFFVLACVLGLAGCNRQEELRQGENNIQHLSAANEKDVEADEQQMPSLPGFSYAEESAMYTEGEPGIKTAGFANTSESEITFENAAEHAEKECTVEYDSVTTYLDAAQCVWKVHFYTDGMTGGDQTVYLDHEGKTLLIV